MMTDKYGEFGFLIVEALKEFVGIYSFVELLFSNLLNFF